MYYFQDYNLDNIVDQQCTRFQEVTEQDSVLQVGMPTCSVDQTEAVRRYYAAFPALKKGQESPLQYYLPPPAWCRKTDTDIKSNMQSELSIISKEWNSKNKKFSTSKERRNSYHGQRKNGKKRCNSYSRSFESKESLPEWVTHEGVWDMEAQDPVKEFIRALALDEGYGTCENTVTDDLARAVPDLDLGLALALPAAWPAPAPPPDSDLYAKFEAKFDRSIEALWDDRNDTPDDDYQELPIDFQDLLSSPSDKLFAVADHGAGGLAWVADKAWPDAAGGPRESPSRLADALHDRLKPLNIAEPEPPLPLDPFSLYEADDIYDAAETVACAMRSLAAINHSRDRSGFAEVPPRRREPPRPAAEPRAAAEPPRAPEDLLTSARTHFRPIRREPDPGDAPYRDGDTFAIHSELDPVAFHRSASGGLYIEGSLERYLEYRGDKGIDYGRLRLTAAQRCPDLDDPAFRLRFPLRQCDAAVQTEPASPPCGGCGRAAKKKRPSAMESIWSSGGACDACAWPAAPAPPDDAREWDELLADIGRAAPPAPPDRKRRHSAALRCAAAARCSHPHARFLACCSLQDRPLTR